MKISFWGLALAALSVTSLSVPAAGAIITQFSDRTTWQAATTGRYDINFNSGITDGQFVFSGAGGANFGSPSVNFEGYYNSGSGTQYQMYWADANSSIPAWEFNSGGLLAGGGASAAQNGYTSGITATIASPTGIRSVGFDFAALQYQTTSPFAAVYPLTGAIRVEVRENGVWSSPIALSNNAARVLQFVGFTTDGEISGIRLSTQNLVSRELATAILDNFSFGSVGAGGPTEPPPGEVPEPSTFITVAAACFLLNLRLRKKI